jgi:peptidoglycan/xylan/chitin deacetylase (PgdA/CDA1 family)
MRLPPVLMYHAVCPAPDGAVSRERRLFVDPDSFAGQMAELGRRGFRCVTLGEYAAALDGRAVTGKSVLLTFDDAYAHVDDAVTPVLRRHGFRAVMFAAVSHLGGHNTWDAARFKNLGRLEIATAARIRALDPRVWEVASHGLHHVDLRTVDPARRRIELIEARERLGELVGRRVLDLAYPHGGHDAAVRRDVERAGYRMAFTAGYSTAVSRFQISRTPIGGEEGLAIFRIKISAWSVPLYWGRAMARRAMAH